VRGHVRANAELNEQAPIEEVVVEKTVDEKINDQIEEALANAFEELGLTDSDEIIEEKVPCPHCDGKGYHMEDKLPDAPVVKEEKLSLEKTVEKLTEKNMLGRLAKSLRLDEQGKEKMFDYFEKGELK
jgi:phosphohistidine swiveling domain-containing protein